MLPKNFLIGGKYKVMFPIKQGSYAETYRVRGEDRKIFFLKLFDYTKVDESALDDDDNLLEIELHKIINHPNMPAYHDSGEQDIEGKRYAYLVLDFIAGETLTERIKRQPMSSVYDVKKVLIGILDGLNYLHNLPNPIIHNEITPHNIMLDLSGDTMSPKIIDFGYARPLNKTTQKFNKEGLDLNYVASECFRDIFTPPSDIYSVGATMYHMLFGWSPWHVDLSTQGGNISLMERQILDARSKPLALLNAGHSIVDLNDGVFVILRKALEQDPLERYQSANEFIEALEAPITSSATQNFSSTIESTPYSRAINFNEKSGFAAIAGMQQLKDQLQHDVINAIENQEEYRRHNLSLPNGMLLYGPPGCGKTFFAEKFAEEAGYNFIKVISSDLASIYIHGSQEKIGNLFKDARQKAPTILYFDEIDAVMPDREKLHNQSQSGEVNEFLSQLDNIGNSGVFVIGSTNKPDFLDKAILRAGRLEKKFYVPPPDFEARRAMFELYLKDRPIANDLNYEELATLTENYVSSDIKLIVDEASRQTIRERLNDISMQTLKGIIDRQKPTVALDELERHENIRKEFEKDKPEQRRRIGF